MGFIYRELYLFYIIVTQRWWVLLIPILFIIFCLILKIPLINQFDQPVSQSQFDFVTPILLNVKERFLGRIDRIALFGSLIIFATLYFKARKTLMYHF